MNFALAAHFSIVPPSPKSNKALRIFTFLPVKFSPYEFNIIWYLANTIITTVYKGITIYKVEH